MIKRPLKNSLRLSVIAKKSVLESLVRASQHELMGMLNKCLAICVNTKEQNPSRDLGEIKYEKPCEKNPDGFSHYGCSENCYEKIHPAQLYRVLMKKRLKVLPLNPWIKSIKFFKNSNFFLDELYMFIASFYRHYRRFSFSACFDTKSKTVEAQFTDDTLESANMALNDMYSYVRNRQMKFHNLRDMSRLMVYMFKKKVLFYMYTLPMTTFEELIDKLRHVDANTFAPIAINSKELDYVLHGTYRKLHITNWRSGELCTEDCDCLNTIELYPELKKAPMKGYDEFYNHVYRVKRKDIRRNVKNKKDWPKFFSNGTCIPPTMAMVEYRQSFMFNPNFVVVI